MARGIRTNPTLMPAFSQGVQPQSLASYDSRTRRNTILIANIVPTINSGESAIISYVPSDRYYAQFGPMVSSANHPNWAAGSSNVTYQNWDATRKTFYARLSNAGTPGQLGQGSTAPFIFPSGPFGQATGYAPKNASPLAVWIRFTARFNANADYGTLGGIGACSGSVVSFSSATDPFIQVLRNAGTWELGTCDGTTISQDAGGTADGGFHEFGVLWKDGVDIRLYVDGVLTITKTTNLPSQPLFLGVRSENNTNTLDIVDYLVEWELG